MARPDPAGYGVQMGTLVSNHRFPSTALGKSVSMSFTVALNRQVRVPGGGSMNSLFSTGSVADAHTQAGACKGKQTLGGKPLPGKRAGRRCRGIEMNSAPSSPRPHPLYAGRAWDQL